MGSALINFDEIYYVDPSSPRGIYVDARKKKREGEVMMRFVGIDIGTGNIASCTVSSREKGREWNRIKDAFFRIDVSNVVGGMDSGFGENVLKQAGANYIKVDGALYVLGDDAFKFANLFHSECLRPMAKGVLNPAHPMSAAMLKELIRGVIGEATHDDDVLYFCVPANPVDAEFNIIYHTDVLKSTFATLGYRNVSVMNEGLAVVYSEAQDEGYSAIGVSLGSGMVNVCYAFMGIPVFSFSLQRAGDWIDENVATATNDTRASVQSAKEAGISILNPTSNAENAMAIYYNALLEGIVKSFRDIYTRTPKKDLPNVTTPLPMYVAGGTSLAGGFIERFTPMVMNPKFPVKVSKVVHAKDPLMAIAAGLCNAALISKKK